MNEKVNARIQALEAGLAKLKKELAEQKKEGRFRAERYEEYKTISINCGKFIVETLEDNHNSDLVRYNNFNYFRPDTDEADRMAEKINLLLAMTARVKELNGDWVADIKKSYGLVIYNRECFINWFCGTNYFIFGLCVQSREHAKILLNEFRERIERWY